MLIPYGKPCKWAEMELEFKLAFWCGLAIVPAAIVLAQLFPYAFGC